MWEWNHGHAVMRRRKSHAHTPVCSYATHRAAQPRTSYPYSWARAHTHWPCRTQQLDIFFTAIFTVELSVNLFSHWLIPFISSGWSATPMCPKAWKGAAELATGRLRNVIGMVLICSDVQYQRFRGWNACCVLVLWLTLQSLHAAYARSLWRQLTLVRAGATEYHASFICVCCASPLLHPEFPVFSKLRTFGHVCSASAFVWPIHRNFRLFPSALGM